MLIRVSLPRGHRQTFHFGEDNTGRMYFGIDSPFDAVYFEDAHGSPLILRERLSTNPSSSRRDVSYEIVADYSGRHPAPGGRGENVRPVSFISMRTHKVYEVGPVNLLTIAYRFSWLHLHQDFSENPHILL